MPIGRKSESEGPVVSPVEFYPGSNGEVAPEPPTPAQRHAYDEWRRLVEEKHRRLGMSRREFADSACGMATALLVMQQMACSHSSSSKGMGSDGALAPGADGGATSGAEAGGGREVTADMTEDMAAARERLSGDEFIVDVQTHPPNGRLLAPWAPQSPQQEALDYIKKLYVQSDVSVAVLTGWPNARTAGEDNVKANAILKEIIDRLGGHRFLFHANANPDLMGEPEYIEKLASAYPNIVAWKIYPHAGKEMRLHRRTDFLERVRKTGIKIIAAHRGLHQNDLYEDPGSPEDIVQAALMFPDIKFLVYHSGFERTDGENHPYQDLAERTMGVDRFVKAMLWAKERNGGKPLENVYADVGTTWATIMGDNAVAGHVLGKLLLHIGEDQVLFGTDSFNGSMTPQAQLTRFRAFDIPADLRQAHGYPALTPEIRRKFLGLNAVKAYGLDVQAVRYKISDDDVSKLKTAYREDPRSVPMPHPLRYRGPRTRREFLAFRRWERDTWGWG